MKAMTFDAAKQNLAKTVNAVLDDKEPVIITREGDKAVIMMDLDDYNRWQETFYLMSSKKNAARLLKSIDELEQGNGKQKDLIEQ